MLARIRVAGVAAALALATPSVARADDPPPAAAHGEGVWVADFDKAIEQAKREKKDLLVDFTGSDWCHWCIKLHEEVFAHDDFVAAARKDFVLVALDYPNKPELKAKVPNPARNAALAQQYGIQGYPTVLLMSADGEVYARTGYQEGGSAKYIPHVAQLRAEGVPALKSAKELVVAIRGAKGADLVAACEKAIATLDGLPAGSGLVTVSVLPVKAAFASDPENKAGIGAKAVLALLKTGAGDADLVAAAEKFDPKNEQGLLERVAVAKGSMLRNLDDVRAFVATCESLFGHGPLKDAVLAKQLSVNCMFMNHKHLKDPAAAKTWAKRVVAFGFGEGEEKLKELVDTVMAAE